MHKSLKALNRLLLLSSLPVRNATRSTSNRISLPSTIKKQQNQNNQRTYRQNRLWWSENTFQCEKPRKWLSARIWPDSTSKRWRRRKRGWRPKQSCLRKAINLELISPPVPEPRMSALNALLILIVSPLCRPEWWKRFQRAWLERRQTLRWFKCWNS